METTSKLGAGAVLGACATSARGARSAETSRIKAFSMERRASLDEKRASQGTGC
jgi:hypothetical protein